MRKRNNSRLKNGEWYEPVVALRYKHKLTLKEIADLLGLPFKDVKQLFWVFKYRHPKEERESAAAEIIERLLGDD